MTLSQKIETALIGSIIAVGLPFALALSYVM